MLAQGCLKTEAATPEGKRVRGMAVAVVGAVIGLHISVRLNIKTPV